MLLPYTFSHYFVFVILLYWVLLFLEVNRKYFSNMGPHQPDHKPAIPEIKYVCIPVQSKVMQQLNNILGKCCSFVYLAELLLSFD